MGKQQQGRSKLFLYAIPCLCLTMLGLLILASQAGPLSQVMWSHHLQNLAAPPLLSTVRSPSSGEEIRHVTAAAHTQSLLKIEAGPCTCCLRAAASFNTDEISPQHMINCTCPSSTIAQELSIGNSSFENAVSTMQLSFDDATASLLPNCVHNATEVAGIVIMKEPCAPQKPRVKVEEPWYVKGRSWHPPPRFPRCTMDACFNYTRCENSDELLIYTYNKPAEPAKFFKRINESKYNTDDPNKISGLTKAPLRKA